MGPWGKGVVTVMHDGEHGVPYARAVCGAPCALIRVATSRSCAPVTFVSQRRALAPPLHSCLSLSRGGHRTMVRCKVAYHAEGRGEHMWHGRAPVHMCLAVPMSFEGCPVCEGPRAGEGRGPDNPSGPSHHIHFPTPEPSHPLSHPSHGRSASALSFCK